MLKRSVYNILRIHEKCVKTGKHKGKIPLSRRQPPCLLTVLILQVSGRLPGRQTTENSPAQDWSQGGSRLKKSP